MPFAMAEQLVPGHHLPLAEHHRHGRCVTTRDMALVGGKGANHIVADRLLNNGCHKKKAKKYHQFKILCVQKQEPRKTFKHPPAQRKTLKQHPEATCFQSLIRPRGRS